MKTIVPLERRFSPWRADPGFSLDWRADRDALDWESLLKIHRVVVLAEAGSGKSTELERAESRLRQDGRVVFRATVQDLGGGLRAALLPAASRDFDAWRAGDQPAWFLIDAADEGPLANIHLPTATRAIAHAIDGAEHRAYIVVTSRYSDWDGVEDLATFEAALPFAEEALPPPPTLDDLLAGC